MRLLYSRNNWTYSMSFDMMIDFCFWILQVDGLPAPPFDRHSDGDGSLRAVGLTNEHWQAWLLQVLHQQAEYRQALQQTAPVDPLNPFANQTSPRFPEPRYPASAWSGSDAVRERLVKLWEQYGPISNQRKRQEPELGRALRKQERRSGKRLYDELRPYHTHIPPLTIYLVEYEQPLDLLVPPATLIMTMQEGQPEPEEFRERVLAAAEELAAQAGRRRKKTLYSRMENKTGQVTLAYRQHMRKPVPPPQSRPELPRLTEPIKQLVLDNLESKHSPYGIVDFATLQFLREKQRAGWQLYEVLFQELDGEQHRAIFMFRQDENGFWRYHGGSSSGDIRHQWSKFFAPVRDHPLLFLSVSRGSNYDHQHLFQAYGDVIDNGFSVQRVRLVTTTGQIFEDTVEDGFVFFVCEQEQPVPLPMQAELYNGDGKLVWRQTVPDDILPPWAKRRQR